MPQTCKDLGGYTGGLAFHKGSKDSEKDKVRLGNETIIATEKFQPHLHSRAFIFVRLPFVGRRGI